MAGYGDFDRMLDTLEQAVTGKQAVAGGAFSAVDVYLGAQMMWGMQFGTLPKRPAFEAYTGALTARAAFQRGAAKDDALAQEMQAAA